MSQSSNNFNAQEGPAAPQLDDDMNTPSEAGDEVEAGSPLEELRNLRQQATIHAQQIASM